MSTLGKIVAVFMVIASVALVAMIVAFVPASQDWRTVALDQQKVIRDAAQARQALEKALETRNAELAQEKALASSDINSLKSAISTAETSARDLAAKLADAQAALAKEQGFVEAANKIRADVEAEREQWKGKYDEVVLKGQTTSDSAASLTKRVNDLQRVNNDLEQKVRIYEVRIVELEKQNAWMTQQFPGKVPEVQSVPTTDLNGLVKAVDNAAKVAEISLGSSDGVTKGTTFLVSRDGNFLCDLEITEVDENSSVGMLKTVQGAVREGDNVTYQFRK